LPADLPAPPADAPPVGAPPPAAVSRAGELPPAGAPDRSPSVAVTSVDVVLVEALR
jgi:hypothetical protein